MKDRLGREIDYIRISITDRCNLRCGYCMPRCGVPSVPHEMILRFDEIIRLVNIFCSLVLFRVMLKLYSALNFYKGERCNFRLEEGDKNAK